ncbi:MAG: TIGR03619 family F420-dependent LLM class oxidoreductase [Actinobacteria bacterium]|nr:TIGR03619 family F420-dependent LLM class oxidoreductase [Actinomycetota bacterium]
MELGIALPHVGPVASRANIRAAALAAEALDYDSVWTLDRLIKAVDPKTPYPPTPDGRLEPQYDTVYEHLSVLTYVAALTERVRLGVSVLNLPFYSPALLAKRLATVDQLSDGRLDVGIGVGWSEDEFEAAGVPFGTRGRMSAEYIEALKALWGTDPVEFHGEFVDVPASVFGPKPVQAPHPPLYMGAFSGAALRRGGRLADGFTGCCAPAAAIVAMRDEFRRAADDAGRAGADLPTVVRCNVQLSEARITDEDRPIGIGNWQQVGEDVEVLRDAGIERLFFDVTFDRANTSLSTYLDLIGRLRGLAD